jgi:hypothetical protein
LPSITIVFVATARYTAFAPPSTVGNCIAGSQDQYKRSSFRSPGNIIYLALVFPACLEEAEAKEEAKAKAEALTRRNMKVRSEGIYDFSNINLLVVEA